MSNDAAHQLSRTRMQGPGSSWAPLFLANAAANPLILPLRHTRTVALHHPRSLSRDEVTWLRIGLGFTGTDRRWMFRFSADNVVRICRSWTGREMYRATIRYDDPAGPSIAEVQVDAASDEADTKVAQRFLATFDRLLVLRERLDGIPSTPQQAWQTTASPDAPWPADLPMLAAAVRDRLPLRQRRVRVHDETATVDAELVDAVVDGDAVLLVSRDGGRIWIAHPWRWAMSSDRLVVINGDVAVWPGRTWGLDPDLATWAAWSQPIGTGTRKLSWTGQGIPPIRNFEAGMPDLTLELVGSPVLEGHQSPAHERPTQEISRGHNGPRTEAWTDEERAILDRLIRADASWRPLSDGPRPGLGRRMLRIAAEVLDMGGRVFPVAQDEFGDLRIEIGDRRIVAFVNDYGEPDDAVWARLIETIGPFPETPATDRALADFSVHGPFERGVMRRSGQLWVEIRVRLGDVAPAFLDLDNVALGLAGALADAAKGDA